MINSIDPRIHFIYKVEWDNRLLFLDVFDLKDGLYSSLLYSAKNYLSIYNSPPYKIQSSLTVEKFWFFTRISFTVPLNNSVITRLT